MTQELDEHGDPIERTSGDDVSKAEAKRLQELEKRAEEMGSGSIEDYMEWLESQVVGAGEEPRKPVAPQKPTVQPRRVDNGSDGSGIDADTLAMLNEVKIGTAHAILESQYTRFEIAEGKKEETERSTYSREQLEKAIKSPSQGAVIQSVAADFNGNMWQAADYVLSIKGGLAKAKADGANSADALHKAKASANPASGGRVAGDGDDDDKDRAKQLADEIAPPQGGYSEAK